MSGVTELLRNAQTIRQRLRYPPNAIRDRGINLHPKRIPPKADINAAIENWLARHRPILSAKVTIMSVPPEDFEPPMHQVKYTAIRKVVCQYFHLRLDEFLCKSRKKRFCFPRHIAFYLGRLHSKASMPEIAHMSGVMDHTTVLHGFLKIKAMVDAGELADAIKMIEYEIFEGKNAPKRDLDRPALATEPELDLAQELPGQEGGVSQSEVWSMAHRSWVDREEGEVATY
jgi:hypothetical protein